MLGAENAVGVDARGYGCERLWLLETMKVTSDACGNQPVFIVSDFCKGKVPGSERIDRIRGNK